MLCHALGREFEPVMTNSFSDSSTTSMLCSWFYLVYLIWYYYLLVTFVMWIVKQKIENKQNLFWKKTLDAVVAYSDERIKPFYTFVFHFSKSRATARHIKIIFCLTMIKGRVWLTRSVTRFLKILATKFQAKVAQTFLKILATKFQTKVAQTFLKILATKFQTKVAQTFLKILATKFQTKVAQTFLSTAIFVANYLCNCV